MTTLCRKYHYQTLAQLRFWLFNFSACLKELRKNTKDFSQDIRSLCQDLIPGPSA
jgi:hypothetical protein